MENVDQGNGKDIIKLKEEEEEREGTRDKCQLSSFFEKPLVMS